jgi:hypothetical protein
MSEQDEAAADPGGRPDYVKCIRQPRTNNDHLSWCDQELDRVFAFSGLDHAAAVAQNKGGQSICPKCLAAAVTCLQGQTWTGES